MGTKSRTSAAGRAPRKSLHFAIFAIVIAAMLLGLVACGSSSKPATSGTTPAGSTAGSSASAEVAAAQAKVQALLADPVKIPTTTPLTSKPVQGKTIVNMACDLSSTCTIVNNSMKDAATAAGWKFKSIQINLNDPSTLIAGIQQALQLPDLGGIVEAGLPEAVFATQEAELNKRGVPLVGIAIQRSSDNKAVPAVVEGTPDATAHGVDLANYFIANSQAQGHALIVGIPAIGTATDVAKGFIATLKSGCTQCTAKEVDITTAQIAANSANAAIVTTLQRNPSIDWVVSTNGGLTDSIPSALNAAGINGMHVIAPYPDLINYKDLSTGKIDALTLATTSQYGWQAVDVALRVSEGMTITPDVARSPEQILTKANLGPVTDSIARPTDYQAQFKQLWHVS